MRSAVGLREELSEPPCGGSGAGSTAAGHVLCWRSSKNGRLQRPAEEALQPAAAPLRRESV